MGISQSQFDAMQMRVSGRNAKKYGNPVVIKKDDGALESALHERIKEYCDSQWPKWKFIHARMDQRSTIQVGAQDFTIFLPGTKTVLIECKRKGGKRTVEQSAWAMEMEKLGHAVHLVTSMDEFLNVLKGEQT